MNGSRLSIAQVTELLAAREPVFHRSEPGTTRSGFEALVAAEFREVGASGNPAIPHLHINLFDQMEDPRTAKVLPFVFRRYESLVRGGHWIARQSALPRAGAVVRFQTMG
jgi:hypothetical protein